MDKIKKVFSPGKTTDDEVMYGTPSKEGASTTGQTQAPQSSTLQSQPEAEQKDKGVFRQIFNPGGNKHSDIAYGTTATTDPSMADQLQKESASSEPLRGAETSQYNNDKVMQEPYNSTSTSYAPTGTTSTGPSTMAREDNQDDVSNATYTSRSYALGAGQSADPQQTSSHVDQATRATDDLGPTGEDPSRIDAGRRLDHSLAGAGTGGAGAGYVDKNELDEFMRHGRDPEADQATYTSRDQYIGSSADADPFNRPGHELSGHVPGEFPRDDGYDPHSSSSGIGGGSAAGAGLGSGAAGIAASRAYNDRDTTGSTAQPAGSSSSPIQTTTNTMRSGSSSKPTEGTGWDPDQKDNSGTDNSGFKGALAAASAAMGFGGAGAYAASRDDKNQSSSMPTESVPASQASRSVEPSSVAPSSGYTSTTQPESTPATLGQSDNDHTARNAALGAGGLGAAGAGAYALGRDDEPSSGTGTAESVVSDKTQSYAGHNPSDRDSNLAGRSAAPTSESQYRQPEEDHTARNAALGAGGLGTAGAGAYALGRDDEPSARDTPTGNAQSVVSDQTQSYTGHNPSDRDSNLAGRSAAPTSESQGTDHTARNAALGAGGLGAAGAGVYGLSRDDEPSSRDTPTGNTMSSSSPSSTNTGNAQSVVSEKTQSYARHKPSDRDSELRSAGTSSAPSSQTEPIPHSAQSTVPSSQPEEDHTARNAALGAGGLGAAGAGAYALGNRDEGSSTGNAQSVVSPETQKYTGHNPSDTDPSYRSTGASAPTSQTLPTRSAEPTSQYQQPEDNTSRNAALGAGALGATGAGAYALGNRDESSNTGTAQSIVSPETQKYTGHNPSDTDPSYRSTGASAPTSQTEPIPHSAQSAQDPSRQPEEDHTARNAALGAGGLGAAGAGAYYLGKDDDPSTTSRETQPYGQTPRETTRTTQPAPTSKTTTTTTSSKPKEVAAPKQVKEATPSTVDTRDPRYDPRYATQPQEEDHTARNVALGAGGLGAAGAGAYALGRDDDKSAIPHDSQGYSSSQPTGSYGYPSDRQDDSTMEGSVFGAGAPSSSTTQPREEDHTARNAALGAGGLGAAGAGAYGLSQRDDTGPASKTLGPHESNAANVMDPRVKPEPTQQYQKYTEGPYDSNIANRMDPKVTSDPAEAQQQDSSQNYGRDAAIVGGTGAAGAAGYGAYEYANRDQPQQSTQGYSQSDYRDPHEKYDPPQRQYAAPSEHDRQEHDPRVATDSSGHNKLHKKGVDQEEDHTGRNAALGAGAAGTAGAAGYGGKEYYDSKHDSSPSTASQEKEKKPSLMHRILHPGESKQREKEEEERQRSAGSVTEPYTGLPMNVGKYGSGHGGTDGADNIEGYHGSGQSGYDESGREGQRSAGSVTEPHTGLPMNVGKYGSGHGGTDGSDNIEGYHQHGQSGYDQSGRPF